MSISRRNLLLAASTAAVFGQASRARASGSTPKYFVIVFANGGWDPSYCLDPKLGLTDTIEGPEKDPANLFPSSEEVRQFGNLPIIVNDKVRPSVSGFFEKWGARTHVVNGLWTGSIAHAPCRLRMFTGSTNTVAPDTATVFGYEVGTTEPLGTVDLSGLSYPGPLASSTGRVGFQSQIKALVDPASRWPGATGQEQDYPYYQADDTHRALVEAHLLQRAESWRGLRGDGEKNSHLIDGMLESLDRAQRFREQGQDVMANLILGVTPSFSLQTEMAADMLQQGLCRAIVMNSGSDWDTHIANAAQLSFYENLFSGLDKLAENLTARGIFEETAVVVLSEMGRTPMFNRSAGKDHHGHTSCMLFGGSVAGDRVSGATSDDLMESLPVDLATGEVDDAGELLKYDNLAAGLMQLLGVDSEPWLPGVTPFRGFDANA